MKRGLTLFVFLSLGPLLWAGECERVKMQLKLPVKLKTKGHPRGVRWGQVEKVVTQLRAALAEYQCGLKFGEVFTTKKKTVYFPLISNLLRTVPDESLRGLAVFNQEGEELGRFENKVAFEKRGEYNYTHFYFQFSDKNGKLQSSGNRILIDMETGKPFFWVRWRDVAPRFLVSGAQKSSGG
ncbi:MAG: hypothetical protein ACE5JX_17855 [Acidobacteriota bacterium]